MNLVHQLFLRQQLFRLQLESADQRQDRHQSLQFDVRQDERCKWRGEVERGWCWPRLLEHQ